MHFLPPVLDQNLMLYLIVDLRLFVYALFDSGQVCHNVYFLHPNENDARKYG